MLSEAEGICGRSGWPPTKQTANRPFRLVGWLIEVPQIGWLPQLGRVGWLFGWIAKDTTADISIYCVASMVVKNKEPFASNCLFSCMFLNMLDPLEANLICSPAILANCESPCRR